MSMFWELIQHYAQISATAPEPGEPQPPDCKSACNPPCAGTTNTVLLQLIAELYEAIEPAPPCPINDALFSSSRSTTANASNWTGRKVNKASDR